MCTYIYIYMIRNPKCYRRTSTWASPLPRRLVETQNSKPQTPNPKPQTLNPESCTPSPKPSALNPKPKTSNPKPQTLNPRPQTPNPKPPTPRPNPQTLTQKSLRAGSVSSPVCPHTLFLMSEVPL